MSSNSNIIKVWLGITIFLFGCRASWGQPTAIPGSLPADFDVQTATSTPDPRFATPTPIQEEQSLVAPIEDAPTHTPDPNAIPTLPPLPTDTATRVVALSTPALEPTPTLELLETPTQEVVADLPPSPDESVGETAEESSPDESSAEPANESPAEDVELNPPLQGGDWDFEADFIPWPNPYGEPCPGASVASGWVAFVEEGPYGSSCMNENLYQPNVLSGAKSQEITFDFIAANSGVYRTIETIPGHRYKIVAYAKHDHSLSPVEMALGVDMTGGTEWYAETVQWSAWDEGAEDIWAATEEIVTATGERMTIFIKGFHPLAEQGGKTVIDNVSVTHLGP